MPNSEQEPEKELPAAQQRVARDQPVEVRLGTKPRCLLVLSKKGENKDGKGGEEKVVEGQVDSVEKCLDGEVGVEGVDQLVGEHGHVLVEEILNKHRDPVVIPVTMDQYHLLEEFELGESKISRSCRCPSLPSNDPDANMSLLDH